MDRGALAAALTEWLGPRSLVYLGLRGDDALPLADLERFGMAFTALAGSSPRVGPATAALEDATHHRPDLNDLGWQAAEPGAALEAFDAAVRAACARPSVVLGYEPSDLTTSLMFASPETTVLGNPTALNDAFNFKPWVERSIEEVGLPSLGWRYLVDRSDVTQLGPLLDAPVVARPSTGAGGLGLLLLERGRDLVEAWPDGQSRQILAVSRYREEAIPLNVGAVVWRDGVTVHAGSVQLIGITQCTAKRFGYCGNDFGAFADLGETAQAAVQRATVAVGRWLGSYGYRGAFGVDYLLDGDTPLLTEVNPRMQGSTRASCELSIRVGESCILLEHIAACAGMPAPPSRRAGELVRSAGDLAVAVLHNTEQPGRIDLQTAISELTALASHIGTDVIAPPTSVLDTGAIVARVMVRERVTTTGAELHGPLASTIADLRSRGALAPSDAVLSAHDATA